MGNDSEVVNAKQIYGIIILLRLYGSRSDTNRRISFLSEQNHRYRHHNVSHRLFRIFCTTGLYIGTIVIITAVIFLVQNNIIRITGHRITCWINHHITSSSESIISNFSLKYFSILSMHSAISGNSSRIAWYMIPLSVFKVWWESIRLSRWKTYPSFKIYST